MFKIIIVGLLSAMFLSCHKPQPEQKSWEDLVVSEKYYVYDASYAGKWPVQKWKIRKRGLKAKNL